MPNGPRCTSMGQYSHQTGQQAAKWCRTTGHLTPSKCTPIYFPLVGLQAPSAALGHPEGPRWQGSSRAVPAVGRRGCPTLRPLAEPAQHIPLLSPGCRVPPVALACPYLCLPPSLLHPSRFSSKQNLVA